MSTIGAQRSGVSTLRMLSLMKFSVCLTKVPDLASQAPDLDLESFHETRLSFISTDQCHITEHEIFEKRQLYYTMEYSISILRTRRVVGPSSSQVLILLLLRLNQKQHRQAVQTDKPRKGTRMGQIKYKMATFLRIIARCKTRLRSSINSKLPETLNVKTTKHRVA